MHATVVVHIVAGALGILSGFVALYAAKGAPLHRQAGTVFVAVMLTMTLTGVIMAAVRGAAPTINIPAGVLTAYLVATGLLAVRPPSAAPPWLPRVAMGVAFGVGAVTLLWGFEAVGNGGTKDGMPAFPYFLFGVIGILAGIGDLRMLRAGALRGVPRITRHLWRMSLALWIAAMSFFIGQADEIPRPFRIYPLLASPVLAVLLTLLYWLWRVRVRRIVRGLLTNAAPGVA